MKKIDFTCLYEAPLYRDVDTIRRDIRKISEKIDEANEMLNIREILSEFMELSGDEMLDRAGELGELLQFGIDTLEELKELNSSLDELKRELLFLIS